MAASNGVKAIASAVYKINPRKPEETSRSLFVPLDVESTARKRPHKNKRSRPVKARSETLGYRFQRVRTKTMQAAMVMTDGRCTSRTQKN